jgi:hypothetical protein
MTSVNPVERYPKESNVGISNRRRRVVVALLGASLALVVAAPVGAATPRQVHLVAHMSKQGYGTFEATGSAVEDGLVCERGTVIDTGSVVGGYQSGQKVEVLSRKEFTCTDANGNPDGRGTFFVKIQIHVEFGADEPYTWVVQGGTGDLEGLGGSGQGVTEDNTSTSNTNVYDGFLVP